MDSGYVFLLIEYADQKLAYFYYKASNESFTAYLLTGQVFPVKDWTQKVVYRNLLDYDYLICQLSCKLDNALFNNYFSTSINIL